MMEERLIRLSSNDTSRRVWRTSTHPRNHQLTAVGSPTDYCRSDNKRCQTGFTRLTGFKKELSVDELRVVM